ARPLGSDPPPATQKGDGLRVLGSGQGQASAGGHASVIRVGNADRLRVQRRSPCDASRPNLFHRMGGLRKGNNGPNVFGCDGSVPGIDFVAASGFNDVSSTGILTYS